MASRSLVVNFVGDTKALEASVKRTNAQLGTLKKTGDQASFSISRIGSGAGPGIAGVSGKTAALAGGVASLSAAMPGLVGGFAALAGTGIGIGAVAVGVKVLSSSFQELAQTNKGFAASLAPVKNELQSAFNNAARPLITQLQPVLKALPATIHELAPAFGQVFGAAAGMIQPLAAGLTNLAKTALPALSGIIKAATGLLGPLLTGLGQFIAILGPGITQAVKTVQPLLAPFLKGFGAALQGIMSGLNVMLKALGPVIGQLGGVFGTIGKDLGALFSTLAPAIKAGTQVFGVLIDVIAGILPVFGKIAAALANALAPAFLALAHTVTQLLPALTPLVKIFAGFAGAVLGDLAGILGAVGKLFQGLAPTFRTLASAAGQVFKALENSNVFAVLASALEKIAPLLAQFVNHLVTGLAPILPVIVSALGSLVNTGINTLVSAFKILFPIAQNLLNQFLTPLLPLIQSLAPVVTVLAQAFGAGLVAELQVLAPILATLAPEILGVWAAVKLWTIAQGLLDLAMDANPIVALGVAVAAIAGGIIYLVTKTNILQDAWSAIKNALGVVVDAITKAWDSVKTKTVAVFNSVKGFIKSYWPEILGLFTFGMGAVVGEVIQNWGTIKSKTSDIFNSVLGFIKKYWPELLGVFTLGVGTIVGEVIQNWGTIKSKTTSVFNSIKGIASDIWQAISGAITGAVSGAVNKVKTVIGGLVGWLVTAWGNIKTGVTSFATSIKTGVLTAIQGALNLVIGFLNDIIGVLDKLPFVNIKKIAPLSLTGSGSQGPATTTSNAGPGQGFYQGGMVTKPSYMVGEEAPTHPEVVLATNPAYRQRNLGLWHQAGSMLGVPGFAQGGVPGQGGNVWQVRTSAEESASGDGWTELSTNGNAAAASGHARTATGDGGWDFATLGREYPHGTMLNIQANGRSGTFPLTDVGDGSSFAPAIGLTPAVQAALGGMPSTADIQMADGSNIALASGFGTLVSGSAHGGGGSILNSLLNIPGDISGAVMSLIADGAKLLIGELPKVAKLPQWLQGLGSSIIGDATGFAKDKASSILSLITSSNATSGGAGSGPVPPPPSGKMPYPVQKALYAAKTLAARDEPYVTGGFGFDAPGLDCSGYVSTVMDYAGLMSGYLITGPLKTWGEPGDGKWITVGVRGADSGPGGHTMMAIDGQYFESSGHYAGGGPHIDSGWSEDFPIRRHPPGLATGGIVGKHPQLSEVDYRKLLGGDSSVLGAYNPDHAAWFGGGKTAKAKAKQKAAPKPKSRSAGRSKPKRGNGTAPNQHAAGILGPNGPLPFNDSDLTGLNSKLGAIFALDGGNGGLGVGPDGTTTQLSALISTNTGNWSDDILFPPPNFGSLPDYSQFVVIPDQLADGTQPPATLSPNINGVSSKLGQVIGWEQGWTGDLNQTTTLSKQMAKPIATAIKRRVDQIAKIKKRVEANLAKIKQLNKQITDNQGALANLSKLTPPVANPKTKAEHKRNQDFQANVASMRSQIAGRIGSLQKQVTPLEAENMTLTGSKTAGGSKGELNSIQTQLGVPGAGASSLSAGEGGGGTSASGLYALQGTVGGWPGMINAPGGDLDVEQHALSVYKRELADLLPQAQAAVLAANSGTTTTTPTSTGGATDTTGTASGGESLGDQVKDQMIEALGLRARSAEALLKAEAPIPGFATGGIPFGGWFGTGGDITASQPTLIGIGDGPGTETASIRRQGQGGGDVWEVHNHFAPGMEVFEGMVTTVVEKRERGQVRQAIRRLPGGGGGSQVFRR